MMKKNGFTLAEVLITLAIIGVVATLTLPSLMSNTSEQQSVTAFRKAINTLNEAAQMNAALDGFDYSQLTGPTAGVSAAPGTGNITDSTTGNPQQTLWGLIASRAQVDVAASTSNARPATDPCKNSTDRPSEIFFRDGTSFCYNPDTTTSNANDFINIIIDTNGLKAPNRVSNCGTGQNAPDTSCLKANRHIADQYRAHLKGSTAVPGWITSITDAGVVTYATTWEDAAAGWAMRK